MKRFNITGVCIPKKNYMVNTNNKTDKIISLIEKEEYFTINRARQYGKTTIMSQVYHLLKDKYLVIRISFEGLDDNAFLSTNSFFESFINLISKRLRFNNVDTKIIEKWEENKSDLEKLEELSDKITELIEKANKETILMIDEVDKSSNNQLFLHFLGMLRTKYLDRNEGMDITFKTVILASVYDIKNLKLKLRPNEEKIYNSPWNIAINFDIDMSFNPYEISTMLIQYERDYSTGMDIESISNLIYKYTSGYPFLVSNMCKIIDEKLERNWSEKGVEAAVKLILLEKSTLFDDLIKNVENHKELYNVIYSLIVENENIQYNVDAYQLGIMYSIFKNDNGKGFYFVESQTGFEQRQDVVITYGHKKYIIELKIWRGEEYHKKGISQLQGYMEIENVNEGYLVIYNKNKNKEYKSDNISIGDKEIFIVWV